MLDGDGRRFTFLYEYAPRGQNSLYGMPQQIRGRGSPSSQSTMRFPPNRVCIWTKA